jgi:hypothetical protein
MMHGKTRKEPDGTAEFSPQTRIFLQKRVTLL